MPATCPHQPASPARSSKACRHLLEARDTSYHKRFTGSGLSYELVCAECARPGTPPAPGTDPLWLVCATCVAEIEERGDWTGVTGEPEVLVRQSGLRFSHEMFSLPGLGQHRVLALQPIDVLAGSRWVAVTAAGRLLLLDLERRSVSSLAEVSAAVDLDAPVALHLSPGAELAVVVNTHGQNGAVFDLATGLVTMRLQRDTYELEHAAFPVAFFEMEGRPLLVHGTAWNRLDVSDPRTGMLLTRRGPTSYRRGEERPAHYLDYFHCGLQVSPTGEWIVDNGWIWHPVGVVTAFSLRRWMQDNVWESEDGPSRKMLCWRDYYWDGPLCWVDGTTVAVWGYGRDGEWLVPGVVLHDVRSGRELRWFAGPAGTLVCDGHLFSFSATAGTSVWDVGTGERLLHDPGLCPTAYHRGSGHFITLNGEGAVQVSRLAG